MKSEKSWERLGMKFNIWNYERKPLPDVLSFVVDNRGKTVPTSKSGHILIATNCVRNENLYPSYEKIRFLSEETYRNWFRAHPKPGDILFVCKGTPGKVCMVPEPIDFCIAQDMVALRANSEIIYNNYLLAVLRSSRIQKQIEQTSVGDVIPHFKKSFFNQILIPIPPMSIQRIVGDYYFALSNKIELNKKINKNLEQQAQAIYQQMFIQNRNANWKEGKLSDLVAVKYGKDHKKLDYGCYPVYGSGGIIRYVEKPLYIGESVLIPRKGTLNNVMYVNGAFWSVDTMFYTEMLHPNIAKFVYHFVKGKDLASLNAGSAVPSMTTNILNAMQLYIPDDETLCIFEETVTPMYAQMQENEKQSVNLAKLRDTLLPRLMSGELDVSNLDL